MIVVADAVRDEGTSYHYQTEGRVSRPHPQAVRVLEETLTETGVSYLTARTWTTDAVYRETPGKVRARRAEGCLTVEMEAAALFAVAAFRKVICGQLLYGGDDVSGAQWDHRNWIRLHDTRARLLELAIGACRRLEV
jgi:uridine phosphorylase